MRVLLVSIAFPPKRDPESLQVAKYCKYLQQIEGLNLQIITSQDQTLFMEPDATHYSKGIEIIAKIKIYENKYLNFLLRKLNPTWLQFPDSKFSFWWQHKKAFLAIDKKPDIVYSRSYPVSSALLALKLKKKLHIPWVLHLSDPWAAASASSLSPATHLEGKAKEWNKKKEAECFALADCICFTSQKTIELYTTAYPWLREKFAYVPNVFDDEANKPNPYKTGDKLIFVYTGGFGEARSPYPLLEAIQRFWENQKSAIEQTTEFVFTGEMTRRNHEVFALYNHIPIIKHFGVIPYPEMVALQRRADILINIDSDIKDPHQAVFFPSKLLDYMVAHRRIIAITNRYSTTHDVVQGKMGDCFEFTEIEELAEHFKIVAQHHKRKDETFFYKNEVAQEFSAQHNAKRLVDIFQSLKSTIF